MKRKISGYDKVLNHLTEHCGDALEKMAKIISGVDENSEVGELADKATNKAMAKRELAYQVKQGERAVADQLGDMFVSRGLLTDAERGEIVKGSRKDESINENLLDIIVRDLVELGGDFIDEDDFTKVLSQHQDHIARAIEGQLKAQHNISVVHAASYDTAPYDSATQDLIKSEEPKDELGLPSNSLDNTPEGLTCRRCDYEAADVQDLDDHMAGEHNMSRGNDGAFYSAPED